MAKAIDLRIPGVKFDEAVKRMIATPPAKNPAAKKPAKKSRQK